MISFEDKKDLMGGILIAMSLLLLGALIILLFTEPFLSADEWFTKSLINMNLVDMMKIIAIDVHPPLYYFIDKAVVEILSPLKINPIVSVKIASIIPYFVILALSLTLIRRKYGCYAGGMVSFSLMSMGIFLTYYLTARMYTWALLFALLGFICVKYILENPCLKNWIMLSVFSIGSLYSLHIFNLFNRHVHDSAYLFPMEGQVPNQKLPHILLFERCSVFPMDIHNDETYCTDS